MKPIVHILLITVILFGCKKDEIVIQNINNNKIDILGHAGMGISDLYPINSLESLLASIVSGADGTEMDVQLTKDSVLVLFHDDELDNSTNMSGLIHNFSYAELKEGHFTNVPYTEYKIARLRDFFDAIPNYHEKIFTLDIKLNPGNLSLIEYMEVFKNQLLKFYSDYDVLQNVYIESDYKDFLVVLKNGNPDLQMYHYPDTYEIGMDVVNELNIRGISIYTNLITSEQIIEAHQQGVYVTIWGVDSKKANEEAVAKNPDMIQTDKLDHLIKLLNQ